MLGMRYNHAVLAQTTHHLDGNPCLSAQRRGLAQAVLKVGSSVDRLKHFLHSLLVRRHPRRIELELGGATLIFVHFYGVCEQTSLILSSEFV
jgi:hypothetical protein